MSNTVNITRASLCCVVCVFYSIRQVAGPRLFTTTGHAYQHLFNISLCGGNDKHDLAVCSDNMTSRNDTDDNVCLLDLQMYSRAVQCKGVCVRCESS